MKKNHHITELISQGEHQRLDFKFEVSDSKKIARTLSAFANTDGGTLLIGVKDNGNIAGIRSEEEYYMIEAASKMYCKPEIPFTAKEWNMEGKIVLEITVHNLPEKPYTAPDKYDNYKAYIRVDDENIPASEVLVLAWEKQLNSKGVHLKIGKPVEKLWAFLDENPDISTNQFCKIARIKYHTARNILSDMLAIGSLGYLMRDNQIVYGKKS
ncbi:MAG: ATP-binding protein [Dysgonamonadaceae bacterium]|jgi:predicted HTH transcriptional regulator|nr:ATP-binding protein [Dysgonamonadaceae bacterium]